MVSNPSSISRHKTAPRPSGPGRPKDLAKRDAILEAAKRLFSGEGYTGVSMDQMLANHIGGETMQPSMVLGCEQPNTGYHETNFSMAYSSHISWSSPTTPTPPWRARASAMAAAPARGGA